MCVLSDETWTVVFSAMELKTEMADTRFMHGAGWINIPFRFMDVRLAGGGAGIFASFEIPRDRLW